MDMYSSVTRYRVLVRIVDIRIGIDVSIGVPVC
jgi:hypothetical protein